jgi:hypothetical protein
VLRNDWPHGIDPDIPHLVVWTKFGFDEDAVMGDLMEAGKPANGRCADRFHVMIYQAPTEFLDRITGGDQTIFGESLELVNHRFLQVDHILGAHGLKTIV